MIAALNMYTTQAAIVGRQLIHMQKENFETQRQLSVMDEEIDDLREQVDQKRRAPISKKRESDVRLAAAKEMFGNERRELEHTLGFLVDGLMGYEMVSWDDTPGLRLKVNADQKRFFVVQITQYGEKQPSKQRPKVRFSEEVNRSHSIQPKPNQESLFGEALNNSQDS